MLFESGAVLGRASSTEGPLPSSVGTVLASGAGVYAFLIADTPYHAYGPGDGWGV